MNRKEKVPSSPKENPVIKANFISTMTYWWLRHIFVKGYKKPIEEEDVFACLKEHESDGLHKIMGKLWAEEKVKKKPSMLRVFYKAFGPKTLFWGLVFSCVESGVRLILPLCLGNLVTYFAPGQTQLTKNDAYLWASGIVICSLIPVLTFHPFIMFIFQVGMKLRIGCCCLIYEKTLALKKCAIIDGLGGRVINLMSNDVAKFEIALCFLHDLWKGPLELFLLGYFIYREIGVAGILGLGFMLSFIPLQAWVGKRAAVYRLKTTKRTDVRVKLMNEIVQGIQVIKMYAWENSFAKMIAKVRRKEINAVKGGAYIRATLLSFFMVSRVSIFLSLISYVYFGNVITARKVFITTSYFNVLNESMVHFWPLAITFVSEGYISVQRVLDYLMISEQKPQFEEKKINSNGVNDSKEAPKMNGHVKSSTEKPQRHFHTYENVTKPRILMSNVTANWTIAEQEPNPGLENVDLSITNGLTTLIGPVGSGKSTFLQVILGELELDDGQIHVDGVVSYASQETWLFEGSIRQNIVFIEDFDEERYRKVVKVCALEKDFELLPYGDATIVGERGISLSGGQKARVNLARAVYKKADIYLLDDPLSAVDAHVGRHIFDKCIRGFLSDKICVLATHQLQYLKDCKHIVLMNDAKIEAQGSYQTLKEQKQSILSLLPEDNSLETPVHEQKEPDFIPNSDKHKPLEDDDDDYPEQVKENQETGAVNLRVYKNYFRAVNSNLWIFSVFLLCLLAQCTYSGVDMFVAEWVNWEESLGAVGHFLEDFAVFVGKLFNLEDPRRSKAVFNATTNLTTMETESGLPVETIRQRYIYVYSAIMVVLAYLSIHRTFAFFYLGLRISKNLHDKMFRGVTRATMYFFNTNPSGRILNRFSKDTGNIDAVLPGALLDCIWFLFEMFAVMTVVAIVNYWLLIPTLVLAVLMFLIRDIYVRTSRSVKRVESLSRSPMFSHTNATLNGLSTIRAFKASDILQDEFAHLQNFNSATYYLSLTTTRAFAFWLDFTCVLYIAIVTFSFLFMDNGSGGSVGLAITQSITLIGMCQWGMRQTAELENQMVSVERVEEYVNLPSEPPMETDPEHMPKGEWPNEGRIKFSNLSLRYSEESEYVLQRLTFEIEPKEKIGIVGRTGAGKSSIIQALFRLAPIEGLIKIDDVDIQKLGLRDLRSSISIIPQDPILFSGTMRSNLDPFEEKTDAELWQALEQVELKEEVASLTGGLECKMSDGGSNFSMGQRQLVCLARALLRNNKILILDEATANVDPETDKFIQTTIREKFGHCTVLTIAHRLHTVMDSDKVLVMDAGQVIEFDHPHVLMQNRDGMLRKLVDKTGKQTAKMLKEIAEESFRSKKKDL
ncbi:probable multidrug resistance-associated protein lethal(2)03659 [Culicoides brevitarsis]|uniref:probable multidrug resistance-associated protein lethal(2)03659 n=1 Tax=Culicoides brevitarsis TaxID=469753 RepID=UPI00307C40DA